MASPTRRWSSATENPLSRRMASTAAKRTRSALAPRAANKSWKYTDFRRSTREISPRSRNVPARASAEDRRISVRSRSKKAAEAVTLRHERERAGEPTRTTPVDRLRELEDHLCGLRVGVTDDERHAGVGRLAHSRVEWHVAEHADAEFGRKPVAAAAAEDLRRHVLDHADHAHARLLRHRRSARRNLLREGLRRRHDYDLRPWQQLSERDRHVTGARWHVDHEHVDLAPVDVLEELL